MTTYLREWTFSTFVFLNIKYRNKLNAECDQRLKISNFIKLFCRRKTSSKIALELSKAWLRLILFFINNYFSFTGLLCLNFGSNLPNNFHIHVHLQTPVYRPIKWYIHYTYLVVSVCLKEKLAELQKKVGNYRFDRIYLFCFSAYL